MSATDLAIDVLCGRLRANDPDVTQIGRGPVIIRQYDHWARIGQALLDGNNTNVSEIVMFPNQEERQVGPRNPRLDPLIRWIKSAACHRKTALIASPRMATPRYMRRIASAVAHKVDSKDHYLMCMGIDMSALDPLFQAQNPLRYLYLRDCGVASPEQMEQLAKKFLRTKAVNIVSLGGIESTWAPVVRAMGQNKNIARVHLRASRLPPELWTAASEMNYLSLIYLTISADDMKHLIEGLKEYPGIKTFSLRACKVVAEKALSDLESLSAQCPTLETLELGEAIIPGQTISNMLCQKQTVLKKLTLMSDAATAVPQVMEAIVSPSCGLSHLELKSYPASIGQIVIDALISHLPNVTRLESIEFFIPTGLTIDKARLIDAFERNGSLTRIKILDGGRNIFDGSHRAKFQHIVKRNRRAPMILKDPVDISNDAEKIEFALKTRCLLYHPVSKSGLGLNMIFKDLMRIGDNTILGTGQNSANLSLAIDGPMLDDALLAFSEVDGDDMMDFPDMDELLVPDSEMPDVAVKDLEGPVKQYIEGDPTEYHIRFGRGDANNKHSGNQTYFQMILSFQPAYRNASADMEKKKVVEQITGRLERAEMIFVDFDNETEQWYIVPFVEKRVYKKICQSLRDDHTNNGRKIKSKRFREKQKGGRATKRRKLQE